jgi:hypothetical protein
VPNLIFWVSVNVSQACGTYESIWVVVLTFFHIFGLSLPHGLGQLLFLCLLRVSRVPVSHCGVCFYKSNIGSCAQFCMSTVGSCAPDRPVGTVGNIARGQKSL